MKTFSSEIIVLLITQTASGKEFGGLFAKESKMSKVTFREFLETRGVSVSTMSMEYDIVGDYEVPTPVIHSKTNKYHNTSEGDHAEIALDISSMSLEYFASGKSGKGEDHLTVDSNGGKGKESLGDGFHMGTSNPKPADFSMTFVPITSKSDKNGSASSTIGSKIEGGQGTVSSEYNISSKTAGESNTEIDQISESRSKAVVAVPFVRATIPVLPSSHSTKSAESKQVISPPVKSGELIQVRPNGADQKRRGIFFAVLILMGGALLV